MGLWSSFLQGLMENIKHKDFDLEILEKVQIFRPFSGLAPSKLKMIEYVHIKYSTFQFSEESNGGGIHPLPTLGPYGTEKSVVLKGVTDSAKKIYS